MKVRTYGTALFSFTDNPFIFTLFIFTYVHMETIGIIMVNTRIIDSVKQILFIGHPHLLFT